MQFEAASQSRRTQSAAMSAAESTSWLSEMQSFYRDTASMISVTFMNFMFMGPCIVNQCH